MSTITFEQSNGASLAKVQLEIVQENEEKPQVWEELTDEGNSSSCDSDGDAGSSLNLSGSDEEQSGLFSSSTSDSEPDDSSLHGSLDVSVAELPSLGSVGHYTGQCSRCCFFPKGRCTQGAACNFCHLEHEHVRRKRGGSKTTVKVIEDSNVPEQTQEVLKLPSADSTIDVQMIPACTDTSSVHYPQQRIAAPQCMRTKPPLAEVLSSKLLQASAGRPVKVWLPSDVKPLKILDASMPAKKRPAFPEHAGKEKNLDPTMPVKKHIPTWLLNVGDSTISTKPPQVPSRVPKDSVASVGPSSRPTPR